MKNSKSIIIIVLIVIIISMYFIILNMKNKNIEQEKIIKEQLQQTTTDNSYISLSTHMLALDEKQKEINNMQNTAGQATATEGQILKNYTAYKNGKLITGTMANNGAVTKSLNAGASYTIPAGYHNGSGKVTANSLASQTQATATASDIASGKTAYVNGSKITGIASSGKFTCISAGSFTNGTVTVTLTDKPKILVIEAYGLGTYMWDESEPDYYTCIMGSGTAKIKLGVAPTVMDSDKTSLAYFPRINSVTDTKINFSVTHSALYTNTYSLWTIK